MINTIEKKLELPEELPEGLEKFCNKLSRLSALGMISGFVMHDVRNALAVISGQTQIIMVKGGKLEPDDLLKRMDQIMGQIDRILDTFDRVGSFTSRAKGESVNFSPDKSLDHGIRALSRRFEAKGVVVVTSLGGTDSKLNFDNSLFDYLILELLETAIPSEDVSGEIRISSEIEGDNWVMKFMLQTPDEDIDYYRGFLERAGGFGVTATLMVVKELSGQIHLLSGPEDYGFRVEIPQINN